MKQGLLVDIGNTSAHFAVYRRGRMQSEFRVKTDSLAGDALRSIRPYLRKAQVETALIASVVPAASRVLRKVLSDNLSMEVFELGRDLPIPIKNRYRNPKQVGIDRLLNAYAAYHRFHRALLVLDFGTAITVDVVSASGVYLGGVIAPGIEISLEALFDRTAMLPKIRLAHPLRMVGRDTVESIRIGCSVGIGGLCDRLVQRISSETSQKPLVLATGGYARFMKKYCLTIDKIFPNLVFEGMLLTHRHHFS